MILEVSIIRELNHAIDVLERMKENMVISVFKEQTSQYYQKSSRN